MSTLTLIRFVDKVTEDYPKRTIDLKRDDGAVERRSFERMDVLPRVGDEIVISLHFCLPGTPICKWYGRVQETYIERKRTVTLKLDKVTHDLSMGVIQLDCTFVKEEAA